jgi:phosphate transport system substrate-binding protein
MDMWGAEKIKLLSIDGVAPTPETITSGEYPYKTAYYAVVRADEAENSAARQVISWLLSEDGQILAEETGYVRVR